MGAADSCVPALTAHKRELGGNGKTAHSDAERPIIENVFDMRWAPTLTLIAALSLGLTDVVVAQGSPSPGSAPKSRNKSEPVRSLTPMVFYLAKGAPHVCGQDCSEWIAAEGSLDLGSAQRLRTFLTRLPGRKPPIFIHSPGGIQAQALAIGRLLRAHKMTAGVAETVPTDCASTNGKDQACAALKRSGQSLTAELRPVGGGCNSACVYALIGATARQVPPGARLGVHSAKLIQLSRDGRMRSASKELLASGRSAALDAELRHYVREMGIDIALFDLTVKVPHEQIRYLSRDEIARFGIDTREFQESRWTSIETTQQRIFIAKFFIEARGSKEFRTNVIGLSCAGQHRVTIFYFRGLLSNQVEETSVLDIAVASRKIAFSEHRSVRKIEAFDTGSSFDTRLVLVPIEFLEAAASAGSLEIIEADPKTPTTPSRVIKLSTQGLGEGIKTLRQSCGKSA